jgi:hypothetical protein
MQQWLMLESRIRPPTRRKFRTPLSLWTRGLGLMLACQLPVSIIRPVIMVTIVGPSVMGVAARSTARPYVRGWARSATTTCVRPMCPARRAPAPTRPDISTVATSAMAAAELSIAAALVFRPAGFARIASALGRLRSARRGLATPRTVPFTAGLSATDAAARSIAVRIAQTRVGFANRAFALLGDSAGEGAPATTQQGISTVVTLAMVVAESSTVAALAPSRAGSATRACASGRPRCAQYQPATPRAATSTAELSAMDAAEHSPAARAPMAQPAARLSPTCVDLRPD